MVVGVDEIDLFRIEGVTKVYGNHYIFKNISFNIKSGEILGIIGKSGSGKTTFLNMLVGLTKPEKGKILYRDIHLINKVDDDAYHSVLKGGKEFKRMYSFASQKPSFYPNLTAIENLRYFGSLYNIPKKSLEHNANSLLELVDMTTAKDLIGARMSGGMQRRLDIACSLIHDPSVLILDEPTSDLDLVLSNKIWDILRTINEKGTTIIIVSHNIAELEHLCDRLIIFKDGKIVAQGSPTDIKSKHLVEESIFLYSNPGNYKKVIAGLGKKTMKNVINWQVKNTTLIIDATNTGEVVRDLVKVLDRQKEKIIEIELRKPSLDKIFVKIEEIKDNQNPVGSSKILKVKKGSNLKLKKKTVIKKKHENKVRSNKVAGTRNVSSTKKKTVKKPTQNKTKPTEKKNIERKKEVPIIKVEKIEEILGIEEINMSDTTTTEKDGEKE